MKLLRLGLGIISFAFSLPEGMFDKDARCTEINWPGGQDHYSPYS